MRVLVIGSGGREHAIIKSLKKNARVKKIYAASGNGGISRDAELAPVKPLDITGMTEFAVNNKIDYVVVAPDDPLSIGMVDALEEKGIRCFGPSKAAARVESSKVFSKNLMKKYNIPTALFETFSEPDKARAYLNSVTFPIVIKADGLALGKGVIIAEKLNEALGAIKEIMQDKKYGESGSNIVIEEYLHGHEATVLAFTDGNHIIPMISSMDHKRVFDGNKGLNTGGMGVIAPNPYYTRSIAEDCMKKIFIPTIEALKKEGCPFKGCLYFGLMLTGKGPMVIEYNARFGDPEAQAVLSLLDTDLLEIMEAVTDGKLAGVKIKWKNEHAACIILASGGYPREYETGFLINGLNKDGEAENNNDVTVFHSGTDFIDGSFYTKGGRVLGVNAKGAALDLALKKAYNAVKNINFEKMHYRKDIGSL
ncbi:MAG: phosphoribosylamine--glycine ligase [Treponema sp.]|nr:phosphoribosylamine--glycine ligase [Treponema sp.]